MTLKKLLLLIVLAMATLMAVVFWYTSTFKPRQLYDAVPADAALIIYMPHAGAFVQQFSTGTDFAPTLGEMDFYGDLRQTLLSLDSLALAANPAFRQSIMQSPAACVMIETSSGLGWVTILQVDDNLSMHAISEKVKSTYGFEAALIERKFNGYPTASLVRRQQQKQISFSITGGLLILSNDREAFEKALMQLSLDTNLMQDAGFAKMRSTLGAQADAHVMLHAGRIDKVLNANTALDYRDNIQTLASGFSAWMALDLGVKQTQLQLNGLSMPMQGSIVGELTHYEPAGMALLDAMPSDTRLLLHMSMNKLGDYLGHAADSAAEQALSSLAGFPLSALREKLGNEIAVGYRDGPKNDKVFLLAQLNDAAGMNTLLGNISEDMSGTRVRRISDPMLQNFFPIVFGKAFSAITQPCFLIEGQMLMVANNGFLPEQLLLTQQRGRVLGKNEDFRQFSAQLSPSSNILLYSNLAAGPDLLNSFTDPRLGYHLNRNRQALGKFGGVALQLSAAQPMLYVHGVIHYQPNSTDDGREAWRSTLSAEVAGAVSVVYPAEGNSQPLLLATDANNMLYAFGADGQLRWKKQLSSPLMSEVISLTVSTKRQGLLFNTSSHIHLTDANGNEFSGFPIRLKGQATNALSVGFDGRDQRILIADVNRNVHSFNLNGRETQGWIAPKSTEVVRSKLAMLAAGQIAYVVIADDAGAIKITDLKGNERIRVKGPFKKAKNSAFYLNRTNAKGVILTTNEQGKLLYVSGSGTLSTTDFGNFSENHYFLYEDFDENNSMDFIYLDGNELHVFDRFKKLLFHHTFMNPITTPPQFVRVGQQRKLLLVSDPIAGEVYLTDSRGKMVISSGIKGETPFSVGSTGGFEDMFVLTGIGNELVCYQAY